MPRYNLGCRHLCWGNHPVATQEGTVADGWPSGASTTELNESLGIVFAHDFSMEFCGYGADSRSGSQNIPNIYEILVNTSSCASNNYCPVDIVNFGNANYSVNEYDSANASQLWVGRGGHRTSMVRRACQQLGVSCQSIDSGRSCSILFVDADSYTTFAPQAIPELLLCSVTTRTPDWERRNFHTAPQLDECVYECIVQSV